MHTPILGQSSKLLQLPRQNRQQAILHLRRDQSQPVVNNTRRGGSSQFSTAVGLVSPFFVSDRLGKVGQSARELPFLTPDLHQVRIGTCLWANKFLASTRSQVHEDTYGHQLAKMGSFLATNSLLGLRILGRDANPQQVCAPLFLPLCSLQRPSQTV